MFLCLFICCFLHLSFLPWIVKPPWLPGGKQSVSCSATISALINTSQSLTWREGPRYEIKSQEPPLALLPSFFSSHLTIEHHPVSLPVCDSLSSCIKASCWLLFGHNNVIIPLLHTLLIFFQIFILSYTFLWLNVLVLHIALYECFMCFVLMWVIGVPGLRVFFVDEKPL